MVFKAFGSTGGTDLLTRIIRTYKSEFKTGELVVIIDMIIVTASTIFLKQIEIALYSGIAIFLVGKVIDIVFEGINFAKTIYIISEKAEAISEKINAELKRGVTGLYGKGMYNNEERLVLLCVTGRKQIPEIQTIVMSIDNKAFVIIGDAREVVGKGFKE